MQINVTLESNDNAAFGDDPRFEVARILRQAARRIEQGDYPEGGFRLNDENGNKCGEVAIEGEDD